MARTRSRELFTLAAVALALGVAFGSAKLFDVSVALGAFFAGMVISGSDLSHKAAGYLQPLQDTFAALFFVAVGMLFEPSVLVRHPLEVLEVLAIIVIGKSVAALLIVRLLGRPLGTALTVAAALAQIGEFSFILAVMGIEHEAAAAGRAELHRRRRTPVDRAEPADIRRRCTPGARAAGGAAAALSPVRHAASRQVVAQLPGTGDGHAVRTRLRRVNGLDAGAKSKSSKVPSGSAPVTLTVTSPPPPTLSISSSTPAG